MELPILEPRQRRLLSVAIPLLLLAALGAYLVVPQIKSYRTAAAAQASIDGALDSAALEQELKTRSDSIAEMQRTLHGDMASVPVRELEAFVVGRLQDVAWRHTIELIAVMPRQGELIEGFSELLFEVELAGAYTDIFAWLWEVRRELGFIVIKEFSLERRDQSAQDPLLTARIKMASYRRGNG